MKREKFSGKEVVLCGSRRLTFPNRTIEALRTTDFGFDHLQISTAFNFVVAFMLKNWAYLSTDHLNFWQSYLQSFAESIRRLVVTMGCCFPPAGIDDGFTVCVLIDNTMNATCRPGGGPASDGKDAREMTHSNNGWKNCMD